MPTSIGNISFGGKNLSDEGAQRVAAAFAEQRRKQEERTARLPEIFPHGGQVFEQLAQDWRIPDRHALRMVIEQSQLPDAQHLDELRQVRTEYLDSQVA